MRFGRFLSAFLNLSDLKLSLVILILAALTRLSFLSYPAEVVFDEVHFGRHINSYGWNGERTFDVHPPHAKILTMFTSKIMGYQGTIDFSKIGNTFSREITVPLRLTSAILGSLLPLLFFFILRQFNASKASSFIGSMALVLDNALIVQSRIATLDMTLLFFIFSGILFGLVALKQTGKTAIVSFIAAGICMGFAVGSKYTGIISPLFIFFMLLLSCVKKKRSFIDLMIKAFIPMTFAAIFIYLGGWYLHFKLQVNPGIGDSFYKMTGSFFTDFIQLQLCMHESNINMAANHPYTSPWWSWPFMKNPIFCWTDKKNIGIYLIGNPVVWFGAIGILLTSVFCSFKNIINKKRTLYKHSNAMSYLLFGYVASYLPLAFVPRILFLYHYYTPLIFSVGISVLWLESRELVPSDSCDQDVSKNPLQTPKKIHHFLLLLCLIVCGFLFLSPITYGFGFLKEFQNLFRFVGCKP